MRPIEFQTQMQRLKAAFGEKGYTEERIKLIWQYVEKMNDLKLEKWVSHFIATSRTAPLPADFLELVSLENRQFFNGPRQEKPHPSTNSIFTPEQQTMLFKITKLVAERRIPNQNEFVKYFIEALQIIIDTRNRSGEAEDLFNHAKRHIGKEVWGGVNA